MSFHDRLMAETEEDRQAFQSIPIIGRAIAEGVDRGLYLHYLAQAYHHVRHTCPLLGRALSRCTWKDRIYANALLEYLDEEKGHDEWILDDIQALGGDAERVRSGKPLMETEIMVGHAYYLIDHISPYAMLGMVHVLEGQSVALAIAAADSIEKSIGEMTGGQSGGAGFSYLRSHGILDSEHTAFFQSLVDGFEDPDIHDIILRSARSFYRLFGDIFRALDNPGEGRYAA